MQQRFIDITKLYIVNVTLLTVSEHTILRNMLPLNYSGSTLYYCYLPITPTLLIANIIIFDCRDFKDDKNNSPFKQIYQPISNLMCHQ